MRQVPKGIRENVEKRRIEKVLYNFSEIMELSIDR